MTQSTAKAEDFATQKNVLPLDETTLLGVFGPSEKLEALVRYPNGDVEKLGSGDMSRIGRVEAVKPDAVYLTGRGKERVLRMPRMLADRPHVGA